MDKAFSESIKGSEENKIEHREQLLGSLEEMTINHIFMCVLFQGLFPLSICPPELTIYHLPENGIVMYILYCNLIFFFTWYIVNIFCFHYVFICIFHFFYGCGAIIQTGCTTLTWPWWLYTGCFQCAEGRMSLGSVFSFHHHCRLPGSGSHWPSLGPLK